MPFETTCPKGHRLQVSESHLGQRIQCPACNESFVVPNGSQTRPPQTPGRGWSVSPETTRDLSRHARWIGRPLVAVGLLLALLSKGCDAINLHSATRASAVAQTTVEQFDDDVQAKKLALQNDLRIVSGRDDAKADDRKRADELRKEIASYEAQSAKDRRSKEAGEWHELKTAARSAKRTFAVNSYWHELFFVFAAVVLVSGLLIQSWSAARGRAAGSDSVMLAIVTYSLFVGGLSWPSRCRVDRCYRKQVHRPRVQKAAALRPSP